MKPRGAGYTLIEVLAAMAVLAVVLPVAMRGVTVATDLGSQARHRAQAATLARLKLDELVATRHWRRTGPLTGDFGTDWPVYHWTASTANWSDSAVSQLDVEVTWTSRRGPRSFVITTLVRTQEQP